MMSALTLSVLDLAPVGTGFTPADALATSLRLARHAERLGYHRMWVAEHHNMPGIASSAPAVLIAHLAAGTTTVVVRPLAHRRQRAVAAELDSGAAKHIADHLTVHTHTGGGRVAGETRPVEGDDVVDELRRAAPSPVCLDSLRADTGRRRSIPQRRSNSSTRASVSWYRSASSAIVSPSRT